MDERVVWQRIGEDYFIRNYDNLLDQLEPKVYSLQLDQQTNSFYLSSRSNFILPNKLYGDFSLIERALKAFHKFDGNLGILLGGLKGTGKSLFAKKLCIDSNLPVILIEEGDVINYNINEFISFITNKAFGKAIIFIDEFEKKFSFWAGNQDTFLELFDGTAATKLLFLLTVNDLENINDKLNNRLGRIRYRKVYNSLSKSIATEVIDDLLVNKDYSPDILQIVKEYLCTFDILIHLINECNLFNESPLSLIKDMNLIKEKRTYNISCSSDKYILNTKTLKASLDSDCLNLDGRLQEFEFVNYTNLEKITGSIRDKTKVLYDDHNTPYFYLVISEDGNINNYNDIPIKESEDKVQIKLHYDF